MTTLRNFPYCLFFLAAIFSSPGFTAAAETITDARYTTPVKRYGHFALGQPHEYARLTATTSSGRVLSFELPEDEVFEDLQPRLIKLAVNEAEEMLTIVSQRDSGARLVLIKLQGDHLAISAQSPAIGKAMRWLNPVGVVDFDGNGQAEIAAVITPHLAGPLKVYQRNGKHLTEIAALPGFSNHVYGSAELALSMPLSIAGHMRLLVPDASRSHLRIIALEKNRLVEIGRCAFSSPIVGAMKLLTSQEISVGLLNSEQTINPSQCIK